MVDHEYWKWQKANPQIRGTTKLDCGDSFSTLRVLHLESTFEESLSYFVLFC